MSELDILRKDIDVIDAALVELFERRMELVARVADIKEQNGIGVLNSNREEEVIKHNMELLKNKELSPQLEMFLRSVMDISKGLQKNRMRGIGKEGVKVGFQGTRGSFGHEAAVDYFGKEAELLEYVEFSDVFSSLERGDVEYGVLPIENSSTGSITQVYDLLGSYGFYIVGEICVKVSHNLMAIKGTKLEDIQEVYSHMQAFEQSSRYFKRHPGWKLIPYHNTAYSARYVAQSGDTTKAAVGSLNAAKLYDLEVLANGINDSSNNFTRFVIIGKEMSTDAEADKISLHLSIKHQPGALHETLGYFSKNGLNMIKIESRPAKESAWEYMFYIDFEGNINDENTKKAIEEIKSSSGYCRILGNYKAYAGAGE